MGNIFNAFQMGGMALQNRFVRSATYDGCAEKSGCVSEKQLKIYSDLAKGEVALIITGITFVHPSGKISSHQNSLADDYCVPTYKKLTAAVHEHGSKIAAQLFHAGSERAKFIKSRAKKAFAPSPIESVRLSEEWYQVMSEDDILMVIRSFGEAAVRAKESGFDAVQIHAGHGYLLSQFLSPLTNRRTDAWGGSLENRLRFHFEIYRGIEKRVGKNYPVFIKIGVEDGRPGGLTFEEGKRACRLLSECGYKALEISLGLRGKGYSNSEFRTQITRTDQEAYFRPWCKKIRPGVKAPVMMVGGLRSLSLMEEVIENGDADLVSLSRPFIREPDFISRLRADHTYKTKCISCNRCFDALLKGEPVRCVQEESELSHNL